MAQGDIETDYEGGVWKNKRAGTNREMAVHLSTDRSRAAGLMLADIRRIGSDLFHANRPQRVFCLIKTRTNRLWRLF